MYEIMRDKLAPGGLVAVQSGSGNMFGRLLADLHRTLKAVFPQVAAYTAFVTSFMDLYSFQVAGGEDFLWPPAARIEACLKERGISGLGWYEPGFAAHLPQLPAYLKKRLAREGRVLTDAEPYDSQASGRQSY
jgi:spermidine synthase